jgi:hypothetical protein
VFLFLIFQLRVGQEPLNDYMSQLGRVEIAHGPVYRAGRVAVKLFMLRCPTYAHKSWELLRQMKDKALPAGRCILKPETIIPTIDYIKYIRKK